MTTSDLTNLLASPSDSYALRQLRPLHHNLPTKNKLKWIGGNLGFSYPVCEEVIDSKGNTLYMDLEEVLSRLDDFDGFRCGMPIKKWHIEVCFIAYESKQLSEKEREIFEKFICCEIGSLPPIEVAKRLILNQ